MLKKKYPPIIPKTKEWPVVKFSKERKKFIQAVKNKAVEKIMAHMDEKNPLRSALERALYQEKLRLHKKPWKVDPPDEAVFWNRVKKKLTSIDDNSATEDKVLHSILEEIITRYAHEIAGNFKPSYYRFFIPPLITYLFSRLLNAFRLSGIQYLFSKRYRLQDKIHITGEVEHLRKLAKLGTIVMVPTHFSHLDSLLIGWVIHALGLPPFIYGAGLNLFNSKFFAYFMNIAGAYKVDRRKKNLLYLETLKTYTNLAIQWNCHSLFFPGGTRSRSGALETNLKLGLLGTAIEAQRINYQKYGTNAPKIFIVPVVFNYHFVLEAPTLIKNYLQTQGQERFYVEQDGYSKSSKVIKFLIKFFTKDSDISVSMGKPMDLFDNYVDDQGKSYSKDGKLIDTQDYFVTQGKITASRQREDQYTKILGKAIVREYHKINCVFSSHLVAFTAFELIKKQHQDLDFYNLFRLSEADLVISYTTFSTTFSQLRLAVMELSKKKKIQMAAHLQTGNITEMITHGLNNLGMYHAKKPLLKNKVGYITTKDLSTLFYYHNRLTGYGLEQHVE